MPLSAPGGHASAGKIFRGRESPSFGGGCVMCSSSDASCSGSSSTDQRPWVLRWPPGLFARLTRQPPMSVDRRPRAVDLFSGCGGMTLGLKQAGFHVCGAVDVDPLSVETYRANHPDVPVIERDIRDLPVKEALKTFHLKKGKLDLLAGCPPCQGFSSMRTLNGGRTVEDSRNDLVFEFFRFVKGLRPRAIMLENVPGLAYDQRMQKLESDLERLGYKCEVKVLDAADYGVPQRRRRVFLVGSRVGPISLAPPVSNRRTVRSAIGDLPHAGSSGDPLHDFPERRGKKVRKRISMIPKDGGSRTDLGPRRQLPCHKRMNGFKDVYGRMAWDDVAPTITGGCVNPSKGRFLHPDENRAITLREAALLQTFPKDYYFSLRKGKYAAALLIGNAVPPDLIKHQAAHVLGLLFDRHASPRG